MKRRYFLRLRDRYTRHGKSFVYIDESGFEAETVRQYAWSPKGKKVYGLRSGHTRPRTSLLAARMGQTFEAPILFEGTCNADIFNMWIEDHLAIHLNQNHVVVMDNATFHKSTKTRELIEQTGATLLFLPPYSPDLNPIENDFAIIKSIREYSDATSLDDIIKMYN